MTSWLAFLLNMTGLYLLSEKIAIGWLFGIAAECIWMCLATQKRMPALVCTSLVYVVLAGVSFVKWRTV
jgi:nicotinamide riboside transporter PnuC